MATFAHISGNIVTNIIVAETLADAQLALNDTCIEYTETNPAGIGWTYDATTGKFSAPVAQTPNNPPAQPAPVAPTTPASN